MALALYDRVQQTGTANTTVSFTLSGSVTGFQSFSVVGNGNTTYYSATDTSGNWEVGIGTYATGGTLTRTTILSSSNAGSAVTFSGAVNVFVTYPSEKSVNLDASGNASSLGTPASFVGTNITGTASSLSIGGTSANVTGTVAVANGGTGLTTLTAGYIPYGNGTSALSSYSGLNFSSPTFAPANMLYSTGGMSVGTGAIAYPTQATGIGYESKGGTSNGRFMVQDGNGRLNQYWNAYTDSGGYKYTVSGEAAARYLMSINSTTGGVHAWYGAPSGTAGTALTWTQMGQMTSGTGGFIWLSARGTSSDFYQDINGNVGIGTSAPAATFHVANGSWPQIRMSETTLAFYFDEGRDAADGLWKINGNQGSGYKWFNAGSEVMRINSSGNVGIGTTIASGIAPKLQVASAFTAATAASPYSGIFVNSTDAQAANLGGLVSFGGNYDASSGPTRFAAIAGLKDNSTTGDYGGYMALYTRANGASPAERMRIDSSGNVGISTSSPSTYGIFAVQTQAGNTPTVAITGSGLSPKLNHYITDSTSVLRNLNQIQFVTGSSDISNYQGYMTFSTMGSAGGTISERMRITSTGEVMLGSNGYSTTNRLSFTYDGGSGVAAIGPNSTGGSTLLTFGTSLSGTYGERMRIDSSGNVGIGTSTLTYGAAVTIQRTGQASLMVWNSGVGSGHIGIGAGNSNLKLYNTYSTGTLAGGAGIDVDSSGNVGIGTVTPAQKLDVVGDNIYVAQRASSTAQAGGGVWAQSSGFWSTPTYSGTGIQQFGSTAAGTTCGISNVNLGALTFQNGANALIYTNGGTPIIFGTTATERMRIDSSGNVGIGTTANNVFDQVASARPLVVQSSSSTTTLNGSTNAITISNSDTTTGNSSQFNFATITGASTNQYTSAIISCIYGARTNGQYPTGVLTFSTSTTLNSAPTEKMRIAASGGVSIGNTTDQGAGALSVASGVYAESTGPFMLNATTVSANFTIPTNYNAQSAGPITINTGITVTVSTGSNWVIN